VCARSTYHVKRVINAFETGGKCEINTTVSTERSRFSPFPSNLPIHVWCHNDMLSTRAYLYTSDEHRHRPQFQAVPVTIPDTCIYRRDYCVNTVDQEHHKTSIDFSVSWTIRNRYCALCSKVDTNRSERFMLSIMFMKWLYQRIRFVRGFHRLEKNPLVRINVTFRLFVREERLW